MNLNSEFESERKRRTRTRTQIDPCRSDLEQAENDYPIMAHTSSPLTPVGRASQAARRTSQATRRDSELN